MPRESLAAAVTQLRDAGIGDDELRAAAARLEVRPVLTAHPTEATRRTILQAHQRLATALRRLDDPELPPSTRRRVHEQIAEEVTVLWQTDEVRSRRPRVVDEVRNGLWFVEASLWQALPRLLRELDDAIPGAPPPLRLGTWIGGDMDGNPNAGAGDDRRGARARPHARARAPPPRRARARLRLGHVHRARGAGPGAGPGERRAVPKRARADLGAAGRGRVRRRGGARRAISSGSTRASRPRRRARRRRRPRRPPGPRRGLRPARGDARPARPLEAGAGARRAAARRAHGGRRGARARTGRGRSTA